MNRRWLVGLLILFVVGVSIRIVHFPFRKSAVLRVIPPDAMLSSRHVAPAEHWSQALEEGLLDPWLWLAGLEGDEPGKELVADAGFSWLLSTLGRRYVATAFVEHFYGQPMPAFIASAWVGGRYTHLARMGFLDEAFPDFQVVRENGGPRVWRAYFPDLPEGHQHVSFSIYEGVAFGIATDHPLGAAHLHEVMRRQTRSASQDEWSHMSGTILGQPDRLRVNTRMGSFSLAVSLDNAPEALRVYAAHEAETEVQRPQPAPTVLADMLALIHPTAAAIAGTTVEQVIGFMQDFRVPPELRNLIYMLHAHASGQEGDRACIVWMAKREYGGRMMRLRVPGMGLAWEVSSHVDVEDVINPVLQRIQAQYNVSWQIEPYGDRGVFSLLPDSRNWYRALSSGERAGVAVWNGFLFLHSSANALDSLLAQFEQNARLNPFPLPEQVMGYLRMEGVPVADLVRMGISSYALWQVMDGQRRNRDREQWFHRLADSIAVYSYAEAVLHDEYEGVSNLLILDVLQNGVKP